MTTWLRSSTGGSSLPPSWTSKSGGMTPVDWLPNVQRINSNDEAAVLDRVLMTEKMIEEERGYRENDQDNTNISKLLQAEWHTQNLGRPFGGAHTGVAVFDLNGDGYDDLLFAAGRHDVDTAFVYVNLGLMPSNDNNNSTSLKFRFSEAIPLHSGSFYQVDASHLSSLPDGHVAVLLAGGWCHNIWVCPEPFQPALLLDVFVSGCSIDAPDVECRISSQVIWEEPQLEDSGNRNGALSMELGNGVDPALILVGTGGLSIYHPNSAGEYNATYPDYLLESEDKVTEFEDAIDRSAGLAVGKIGQQTGIVLGTRSSNRDPGPVAMVVVYQTKTDDGGYEYRKWNVDGDEPEFYADESVSLEKTGVTLADLNGDGNVDIISASYVRESLIDLDHPVKHTIMLADEDPSDDTPLPERTVFASIVSGRTVTSGQLFPDSHFPDLIFAMATGELIFFANQGTDDEGNFNGFVRKGEIEAAPEYCEIRDVRVVSLAPCTQSIVTAITCGYGFVQSENKIFTTSVSCTQTDKEEASVHEASPNTTNAMAAPISNTNLAHTGIAPCKEFQIPLEISVSTDTFPEDTAWVVLNVQTKQVVAYRETFEFPNTVYTDSLCLYEKNTYMFILLDEHGDSLCCDHGRGEVLLTLDKVQIFNASEGFGFKTNHTFAIPSKYCSNEESLFELNVESDDNSTDISWSLESYQDDAIGASDVHSNKDSDEGYSEHFCIPRNQMYSFTLLTFTSNTGNGNFSLSIDGAEIFRGGEAWDFYMEHEFGVA